MGTNEKETKEQIVVEGGKGYVIKTYERKMMVVDIKMLEGIRDELLDAKKQIEKDLEDIEKKIKVFKDKGLVQDASVPQKPAIGGGQPSQAS